MDTTDNNNYVIINVTHNTYLTRDINTGLDYFQPNAAIAKKHNGKKYAEFCRDTMAEQYPHIDFNLKQINS